ncbi:hypothetical protein GGR56DRAFT_637067 [Xylariaceae sp. FL0804]|nr:hypothetical protein GGR56DRAFT_637067 [Xylariaceae sp. FL0804]
MASPQDLQELIRLMTVGMKVPIKDAMSRVRALQTSNLRSIKQIAEASLADVESALKEKKAARPLQNACKARLKNPGPPQSSKRAGGDLDSAAKRARVSSDAGYPDGPQAATPQEIEASLELPVETDEQKIADTVLVTNRAPLVLAFAVELLRHTMPEQPPSSRLSLAQAVVSANSRTKAVSIGLEKGASADEEGWGHGQPKVRVMGREVTVLKRGGYQWKSDEGATDDGNPQGPAGEVTATDSSATPTASSRVNEDHVHPAHESKSWSVSQPVTLKGSTFVVRVAPLTELSQRQTTLQSLFRANPSLETATHNAWACRVQTPTKLFNATTIREDSFDDGESGCGDFLLKNLREANAVDVLVVMTRWYGGVMLGPDRWRIMRSCLKEALSERLRVSGEKATLGGEAVWGLDLEAMKNRSTAAASSRSFEAGVVGMPIHRPEAARAYLLKSFSTRVDVTADGRDTGSTVGGPDQGDSQASPGGQNKSGTTKSTPKKKTAKALELEKEENIGRLLGALRLLYDSWKDHVAPGELDRRAWGWYVAVRPEVDSGPAGWGAKGRLKLADILALRRKDA